MALFLKLLRPGGRAAAHLCRRACCSARRRRTRAAPRRTLVEDHKLDAIVKLPSGVFRPYAGVSTAIVFFTKTNSGGTDHVWFYDVQADGMSSWTTSASCCVREEKFGPVPQRGAQRRRPRKEQPAGCCSSRWHGARRCRSATTRAPARAFAVTREDDRRRRLRPLAQPLSGSGPRSRRPPRSPRRSSPSCSALEDEIGQGLKELEAML